MISLSSRHKARYLAIQAIYQWQFGASSIDNVIDSFLAKSNAKKVDVEYFSNLVNGVSCNQSVIDKEIELFLDRKITELDKVELAVLRIATYELMFRLDVPYKVIINEALELTKTFGSKEGFKYVNGVLDKVAGKIRVK